MRKATLLLALVALLLTTGAQAQMQNVTSMDSSIPDWQWQSNGSNPYLYNITFYQQNGTNLTGLNTFFNGTVKAQNSTFFYYYLDNATIASRKLSNGAIFFTVVPTSFAAYNDTKPLLASVSFQTSNTSNVTEPDTNYFDGNLIQGSFSQPNAGYYLLQVFSPSTTMNSTDFVVMVTTNIYQNFLGARGKAIEGNMTNDKTPLSYYIYRGDPTTKTIVQLENCYGSAQIFVQYPDNTTANYTNNTFYLQGPVGTYMLNVTAIENASLSYGQSLVYTIQTFEVAANFTIPYAITDGLAVINATRVNSTGVHFSWPTLFFPTAPANTYVMITYDVTITKNYEAFPLFWRCGLSLGDGTEPEYQQSTYYNNMVLSFSQSGTYYIGVIARVGIMNMTTQVPSLSVYYSPTLYVYNAPDDDDGSSGKSVAIAFLVILIIVVVLLGIFIFYKRYMKGREDKADSNIGGPYGQPGYGRRDEISPANQVKSNFAIPDSQGVSPPSSKSPSKQSSNIYQGEEYNPDPDGDL